VTGTVTAFWRELRGSGSFMDTDPAKIRAALTASCGAMGSLAYGRVAQKWHRGGRVNLACYGYAREINLNPYRSAAALTLFVTLTRARDV
jgi:hypothetical protein